MMGGSGAGSYSSEDTVTDWSNICQLKEQCNHKFDETNVTVQKNENKIVFQKPNRFFFKVYLDNS